MKALIKYSYTILIFFTVFSCKKNLESPTKAPKNIILIVADDLGYMDLEVYGSSFYDTPNLDQLANESIVFTDGYANCPVCSPSRASIQTGKYPAKTGVTDWIKGRKFYTGTTANDRWIVPDTDYELKLEETTIAEAFKQKEYTTAFVGKWHLGDEEKYWPENQGYDINIAGWSRGRPMKGYFSPYGNPRLNDGPVDEYLPDRLTSEAIQIIKDNNLNQTPLFLCLSYYLVHTPLQAKEDQIQLYKEKREQLNISDEEEFLTDQEWMKTATGKSKNYKERIVQAHPTYAAMVKSLDDNVGRIITYLKENKLFDNSLIVFTSDNGGLSTKEGSPTSNLPLAKGKGWMYEGGIRVPFFIKEPQQQKGRFNKFPVTGADIYPTLLDYAKIPVPNSEIIDGISLKSINDEVERPLFWYYPHYGNQGGNPSAAIRLGDYKLIHDLETGSFELYNLNNDIAEAQNLADEHPKTTQKLKNLLNDWVKNNYNRELIKNPNWNQSDLIVE